MLGKYYVLILSLNKSGGNAEEITRKDDLTSAENLFYDKCSQYGGNAQTGYVVVSILDMYGRTIKSETIDRLPHPEPEPNEEA
jgi:hypothetical protein